MAVSATLTFNRAEVRFTPKRGPGEWEPTPPEFAKPLAPHWPTLACFALRRGYQCRADGPPKLTDRAYTAAFDEVNGHGFGERWCDVLFTASNPPNAIDQLFASAVLADVTRRSRFQKPHGIRGLAIDAED